METNNFEENKLPETANDKNGSKLSIVCVVGIVIGLLGVTTFFMTVIITLSIYERVYLFDGYDFTKILVTTSIVFMIIGICAVILKCIIGKFPTTILKKALTILLVIACLGFSIWGITDCNNNLQENSNYSSSGGGSGSYDNTVSEYLGLSLSVMRIERSGSYSYVYCSVKNVSYLYGNPTMYRYIKVKAVFKNAYGSIVDTDWTYAIDSTWLNSGETKTFYYMVRDTSIRSATLTITN